MKNFKDLTVTQKKSAVSKALDLKLVDFSKGNQGKIFNKLSSDKQKKLIDVNGKFCGCYGCLVFVSNLIKRDNEIKEFLIGEAQVEAENAFYKASGETVFDED